VKEEVRVAEPAEAPAHAEEARPGGLRALLDRYRYPLTVFGASRLAVYVVIAMEGWTTRRPRGAALSWQALFAPLGDWDAVWYRWIAEHGYDPAIGHGNTPAFFPLFPLAWRALLVLPGPATLWATLLSSACFGAALCLFHRIGEARLGAAGARRATLYLAFFPLTFVFSLPYAESLFLLLALVAFALTWHERWWLGSAAGALAVLARPVGIALLPALAWRRYRREGRRSSAYLPLLLLPLAELAFFAYLAWRTGDPLAHAHAQERGWQRGVSVLPVVVLYTLWHSVLLAGQLRFLIHVGFAILFCYLWYHAWRRLRLDGEYLVFAALLILLPTSGGLLVSMGRFGMVAFPLFWALGDLGRDARVDTALKIVSPMLMAALVFITFGPRTFTP
jgi:hypothetical protein